MNSSELIVSEEFFSKCAMLNSTLQSPERILPLRHFTV